LTISRCGPWQENRTAEATVNGKAGSFNQCRRYCRGRKTLNEAPIPQEADPPVETPELRAAGLNTLKDA